MPEETFRSHLSYTFGISEESAQRILEEFLGHYGKSVEEYVRERHLKLQEEGIANEAAFRRLKQEIAGRRFRAPELTIRQIRRMIYG